MMKTISAYAKSPWQFELREIELPEPGESQVLIKVEACGVCGTDLSWAEEKMKDWQAFGHEIAGVVVQTGDHCGDIQVEQRVVLESSSYCGKCDLCRNGRVDLCMKAPSLWGQSAMGFSEYMLTPACGVVPYEGLSPKIACLAEPAGVALDMVKTAGIDMGDKVCLVGPGPIGLMAIPLAFAAGAAEVVCVGRKGNSKRLEMAGQLGAKVITHNGKLEELEELKRQFDVVLMTAPARIIPEAMELLSYGARMSYIGIGAGEGKIQIDANDFHFRKLQLRASMASPAIYYPLVLNFMKSGLIPGHLMVTHTVKLEEINSVMQMLREGKEHAIKVVVQP